MPAGTIGDPLVLSSAEGVHTITPVWHMEDWWGGYPYPICIIRADTVDDVEAIRWTPMNGATNQLVEACVFIGEVYNYPDWYSYDAYSWYLVDEPNPPYWPPDYEIQDTIYDEYSTFFVLIDWGYEYGAPVGAIELTYEVIKPISAPILDEPALPWTVGQTAQFSFEPNNNINIGHQIYPTESNPLRAIVMFTTYYGVWAALIDVTVPGLILDEVQVMNQPEPNQITNFAPTYHVGDRVFMGTRLGSGTPAVYAWRKVTAVGDALVVETISAPAAFSSGGVPSTNTAWLPSKTNPRRGLTWNSYSLTPRVMEVGNDGSVVSTGAPLTWPTGGSDPLSGWNFWSWPAVCPDDPSRFWVFLDNWNNTVIPTRFAIVRMHVDWDAMTIEFETEPHEEATEDLETSNSGSLLAISTSIVLDLGDVNDIRFFESAEEGSYVGFWIRQFTLTGDTLAETDRRSIFKAENEAYVAPDGTQWSNRFHNTEAWFYAFGVINGFAYLHGELSDPGDFTDPFGYEINYVETEVYASLNGVAMSGGIFPHLEIGNPLTDKMTGLGTAEIMGEMIVYVWYERTNSAPYRRHISTFLPPTGELLGGPRDVRVAFSRGR